MLIDIGILKQVTMWASEHSASHNNFEGPLGKSLSVFYFPSFYARHEIFWSFLDFLDANKTKEKMNKLNK
jgi:hypothetical protein